MKNKVIRTIVLFVSIWTFGQQNAPQKIAELFATELEKKPIKSAFLHVYSKSKGIDLRLAESTVNSENVLTINTPFYTASITKMLTATAVGMLKDQKRLNFEDKIAQHLPKSLIEKLHVLDGNEYSKDITIAHLLQHTSGLPDYFTDNTIDGSPNIINQLLMDTARLWSPEELIQFSKEKMEPHFAPGEGYHYTDTEYVLLALLIEKVSGLSLNEFFKQHIFKPLGMNGSYINLKSSPLKNEMAMAEFYAGDAELSTLKSLSADWGGGGLVATTQDLTRFLQGFNNDALVKKETRQDMQQWVYETVGMDYGYGLRKVSFKELYNNDSNLEVIGHTGSTASFLWYCPQLDTYVSGTLNQLEASKGALNLVYEILKLIQKE
ncbi:MULTISPECIES: serine hydrolase domain-containing protein [Maribacter]|uniref:Serine hydrolase domain-containing protein n=1 Tax=Maribacter flavus TaxID=1658664 RepID=A0ABU7IKA0_9FLAO|nr:MULTISPECIES: serine hydrolase domain-containing protein [Maribacter]MDC6406257.1 serine hydrolase [Maribacter sp. PR66]MEE1973377.1 serine hydrolase domain-containing protein [Maribacter flavus]